MFKKIMILSIMALFLAINLPLQSKKSLLSNISKGKYVPTRTISRGTLRRLPIPSTNENYAFIQNIGKELSVVLGEFRTGHRKITWYRDKNSDGKVDLIMTYFVDKKKYKHIPRPGKVITVEKFKKMKEDILNGVRDNLSPNAEGISYIKKLMIDSSKIHKWKNGFRVVSTDTDDSSSERARYFFSNNKNRGVDLIFNIKYNNLGVSRISPVINFSVFCKRSKDQLILDTVKKLSEIAGKNVFH